MGDDSEISNNIDILSIYNQFYDKYILLPNSTPDELTKDLECYKPSGDPLIDVSILKCIGDLCFRIINKQKWSIAPNIKEEIINLVENIMFDIPKINKKQKNINCVELGKIIDIYIDNYDDTPSLLKKISDVVLIFINNNYDFKYRSIMKLNFQRHLNYIFNQYCTEWEIIKNNYQISLEVISSHFDNTNQDQLYIDSVKLLENIDVSIQFVINELINKTIKDINIFYINVSNSILEQEDKDKVKRIEKIVFTDFENKVNKIYDSVLTKLKLRTEVNKVINDIFRINKPVSLLTLKMQLGLNSINNIINID